jgi:hypothetical protein
MDAVLAWLATSPIAAAVKVFIAVVLAMGVADWQAAGTIHFSDWQTWVIAALASTLPVIVNWLNPADTRYRTRPRDQDA